MSQIHNSWQRCQQEYNLDPDSRTVPQRLTRHELIENIEQVDELLIHTSPVFDRLRLVAKQAGYGILVSDAQGVVLQSYYDSSYSKALEIGGLAQGSVWSEQIVGTNGLGTCLAAGEPITVYGPEHYILPYKQFSCSAAPLLGPKGKVLGALDLSTLAQHNRMSQGLALNLVCDTADAVEVILFKQAYQKNHLVVLSHSIDITATAITALIAVDDSGDILDLTTAALRYLAMGKRHQLIGQNLQALLNVSLERSLSSHQAVPIQKTDGQRPLFITVITPITPRQTHAPARLAPIEPHADTPLYRVAGSDVQMQKKARICHRIVDRQINILLQGETGTGKEVWAKAIHDSSQRHDKPFVALNCAAIPESLIESELFGYKPGTFTGGNKGGKTGMIEASDGGTLFLDEIGDMPLALQSRLLRVLAEKEITPLGQVKPVPIDLNVICATHKNLQESVKAGSFREDLYYRISGVMVSLPALRERGDRPDLINSLFQSLTADQQPMTISADTLAMLSAYPWPGNIRQLKNVLQYAICLCEHQQIEVSDLPEEISTYTANGAVLPDNLPKQPEHNHSPPAGDTDTSEKLRLTQALDNCHWKVSRAAEQLGISRSTLHRKIKKYNLG